jgi:hypothetical protein
MIIIVFIFVDKNISSTTESLIIQPTIYYSSANIFKACQYRSAHEIMHAAYRIGVLLALANARSYAARRHRLRKRNKTLRSKSAHEFIYATCRIGRSSNGVWALIRSTTSMRFKCDEILSNSNPVML